MYLNPQDTSALSRPEWEEFDGCWDDVFDGESFVRRHGRTTLGTRCIQAPNRGADLISAYQTEHHLARWQLAVKRMVGAFSPERAFILFRSPAAAALGE